MKQLAFTKTVAAGNDFVIIDLNRIQVSASKRKTLAVALCDRKGGIGADGVLYLDGSSSYDIKMSIFNADGSEAEMCGNGARCVAWYCHKKILSKNTFKIETRAGLIFSEVKGACTAYSGMVKVRLTDPKGMRLDIPITVASRSIKLDFVNTGVPHVVIFVHGIEKLNVKELGQKIRQHKFFSPKGTNVNFVQILGKNSIRVRTYERGVEDETLACGTGASACAIITAQKLHDFHGTSSIDVHTQSKEILKVYFEKKRDIIEKVWLEGKVYTVFDGIAYY